MYETATSNWSDRKALWLFGLITVYFAIQIPIRLANASSLSLDEAEMMVITQTVTAGYGVQPPLYGWLQSLVFVFLGPGILALAVLRAFLVWTTFVFCFLIGRQVFGDDDKSWASAMALFTVPQFFWGSQYPQTHTVLAVAVGAITLCVMLLMLKTGALRWYLALGVCFALGTMAKYNYLILALALWLSALAVPDRRRRVLDIRMLATLAVALALLAPHLHWVMGHVDVFPSRMPTFGGPGEGRAFLSSLHGAQLVLSALVSYAGLTIVVFLAVAFVPIVGRFADADEPTSAAAPAWAGSRGYILRVLAIGIALVLGVVVATRISWLSERWLHPVLFMTPLGSLILLESRFTTIRIAMLNTISATLAIGSIVGQVIVHAFPEVRGQPRRALSPYPEISKQIKDLGFEQGYILASSRLVGGNLRLHFADSVVGEPRYGLWSVDKGDQPRKLLLAWDKDRLPPPALVDLWQELCGRAPSASIENVHTLSAPYQRSDVVYRLNVAIVDMCL